MSLLIVPDRGQFAIGDNPFPGTLPIETEVIPEGRSCQKDVLVWNYEGLSYLLVVCVDEDVQPVAARMQEALRAAGPAPRR